MKRYETYKDSGIIRVEKIPENWKVVNFRYLIDVLTDFTANGSFGDLAKNVNYLEDGFSRLIRLTDLRANFSNKGVYLNEHSHKYLKKSELFGGEILLANVGAYAGLAWVFENFQNKASLGPNMFLLKFKETLNEKYAYIALTSYYLHSQLLDKATSSAQPKLNKEDVKSCKFILPSLTEQTQIIKYLDYKTGLIDTIIAQKEELIKKLKEQRQAIINEAVTKGLNKDVKLKDSGIEWLGEIPEHWEVVKLKYLVNHSTAKGNGNSELKIALENIESGTGRLLRNDEKEFEGDLKIFEKDDILFNKLRPYLSKVLIAPEDGECVSELLVFKARQKKVFYKFLFHRLSSEQIISIVDSSTYGAKMPRASIDFILELPIPVPEIIEQETISDFINKKQRKIDISSNKLKLSIQKLKEYRQSLISEAVTGKIDVRDWQAPKS